MIRLYRFKRWLKKHWIWLASGLLIITCLSVIGYQIYQTVKEDVENKEAMAEYESLQGELVIRTPDYIATEGEREDISKEPQAALQQYSAPAITIEEKYPKLDINHKELKKMNPDYIGWIYFPAFDISYPVVQERYVDQYLRTTFQGTPATPGTIFMDILSDSGFSGMSNFLFGHNMRDKTMFGRLTSLLKDTSPIDKNPYFYIYTKDYIYRYRVFAFYYSPVKGAVYADVKNNDLIYRNVVNYMLENNLYKAENNIDFNKNPRLLSLSTCQDAGAPGRFLVTGARDYMWYNR